MTRNYFKERSDRIREQTDVNELLVKNTDIQLKLTKTELQNIINRDSFLRLKKYSAKRINELVKAGMNLRIDTVTKLQTRVVYISGDTIFKTIRESVYNDGWNIILNMIQGDSIYNNVIIQDSLYFINNWSRKWFLGKRNDKWELINRNPKANYNIDIQIKKIK